MRARTATRSGSPLGVGVLAALLMLLVGPPAVADGPSGDRLWVLSLEEAPGGSGDLFAVRRRLEPDREETELLRLSDGTWESLPARGWTGLELDAVRLGDRPLLLSPVGDALQVSSDEGRSFQSHSIPAEHVSAAPSPDGGLHILTSSAEQGHHLYGLPSKRFRPLPDPPVDRGRFFFHPDHPELDVDEPHAFVAGVEPATGFPAVARCDASFRCDDPSLVASVEDVPTLYLSPSFGEDRTLYAATTQNGLFRSSDGGRTFAPVRIRPPGPDELITTVQSMAFRPRGGEGRPMTAYAAVLAVSGEGSGGEAETSGGVFASSDGGVTWEKVGGSSPLDTGATALADEGERLFAAFLDLRARPSAGILCTLDEASWEEAACVKGEEGKPTPAAEQPATPHGGRTAESPSEPEPDAVGSVAQERASGQSTTSSGSSGWLAGGLVGAVGVLAVWLVRHRRRERERLPHGRGEG